MHAKLTDNRHTRAEGAKEKAAGCRQGNLPPPNVQGSMIERDYFEAHLAPAL
jgi:hypothetical protein